MDRKAKELLSIFTFPFGMLLLALFPGMNCFVYSGHGGLGWFILPFSTPYVLVRFSMLMLHEPPIRNFHLKFGALALVAYIGLLYPLSSLAVYSINACTHMELQTSSFYKLITFPIGLAVPPYGEANQQAVDFAFWFW